MKKVILISLLTLLISSLSTYSFNHYGFSQDTTNNAVYNLGFLNANDLITCIINFTQPTPSQPRQYHVAIYDDGGALLTQPGNFSVTPNVHNVPLTPGIITMFEGNIASSGYYRLGIRNVGAFESFQIMNVDILINGVNKYKVVDTLRFGAFKLIYISEKSLVRFVHPTFSGVMALYSTDPANKLIFDLSSKIDIPVSTSLLLDPGFYALLATGKGNTLRVFSYQSDPYPCEYDKRYRDINGLFAPCDQYTNFHQSLTIQGHQCGPRQFYNGSCHNVDESCNTFNALGGECLTCRNLTHSRDDPHKKCVPPSQAAIECSPGLFPVGSSCLPLPQGCSSLDLQGACSSCVSPLFQLSNGRCSLKICPGSQVLSEKGESVTQCSQNQQEIRGICRNLPPNCIKLAPHLACEKCQTGFHFQRGDCVLSSLIVQP